MLRPPDIALLVEGSMSFTRGLIRGVSNYAQANGPWRLHLVEQLRPHEIHRWLAHWPCDGLIARVKTPAIASVLTESGLRVVNVWGTSIAPQWPRVEADNAAVSRLAAGHLLERGYSHFGYCGMSRYEWSESRKGFFAQALDGHGFSCASLDLPSLTLEAGPSEKDHRALCNWIAGLPKPLGIMSCWDHCGRAVLEACAAVGLAVPDAVGVVGVDNDDLVCELCSPPLSSVELNSERSGYGVAFVSLTKSTDRRTDNVVPCR